MFLDQHGPKIGLELTYVSRKKNPKIWIELIGRKLRAVTLTRLILHFLYTISIIKSNTKTYFQIGKCTLTFYYGSSIVDESYVA